MKLNVYVSIAVIGAFTLGWFWGDIFKKQASPEKYQVTQAMTKSEEEKNFNKIKYIFDYVSTNHIYRDKLDKQQMWENAFGGMLRDVDGGLTQYVPPIKQTKVEQQVQGFQVGFGITLDKSSKGILYIQNIAPQSQAEKVGVALGDNIISINDIDVTKEDVSKIAEIMGKEDKIKLVVQRKSEKLEFNLKREIIVPPDFAHYQLVKDNVHYIKIDGFNDKTVEDFDKIIKEHIKDKKGEAIILDLRDNYGGTLESYQKIANYFIDKNTVLYKKKSIKGQEEIKTSNNKELTFNKYFVLVNQNTASAAEILTSNFKELLNASIIGTKTYGKGTIQSVIDLKDNSYLYVTDKEYLTSKNNSIQGKGITPDYVIQDYIQQFNKAVELSLDKK